MARILITGGCGFIGSAAVAEFHKAGHDVWVVDNNSYGSRDRVCLRPERFHEIDILDAKAVDEAFAAVRPEAVVHLAAVHFIPHCNKFPFDSANVNLRGTAHVLDASRACGTVGVVLFASTAAVYPIVDHAIPETHPIGPLDIYGLSKAIGERLCNEFHLESEIPTVIARFFNAFGPNETNPHLIPEIHRQLVEGKRRLKLGNLEPKRDFIHTQDMAVAMRLLIDNAGKGIDVFNLGSGNEYSVREIVDAFARELGEEITVESDPDRVRKVDRLHLLADICKLKARIGWQPECTLEAGVRDLLQRGGR